MTTNLHTCQIIATVGCSCPDNVRWFNCRCAVVETSYNALPLNYHDVLEGYPPDICPTVEAVAEIIRANPGAKIRYCGGNSQILGGGKDGIHIDLARELAKKDQS